MWRLIVWSGGERKRYDYTVVDTEQEARAKMARLPDDPNGNACVCDADLPDDHFLSFASVMGTLRSAGFHAGILIPREIR